METPENYQRDLLSLRIEAHHHLDNLEARALELEELVVLLAELLDPPYLQSIGLDEGHLNLLENARRHQALRRSVRDRRIAQGATPLSAVPDPISDPGGSG